MFCIQKNVIQGEVKRLWEHMNIHTRNSRGVNNETAANPCRMDDSTKASLNKKRGKHEQTIDTMEGRVN